MEEIAPLFLEPWIIESIDDNLVLFKIMTNYFGSKGRKNIPYVHQHLTSIRQVRNHVFHKRATSPAALIRLYESFTVMAEVVQFLGDDEATEPRQALIFRIISIAEEWKRILVTKCGYCFPPIRKVIKIDAEKPKAIATSSGGTIASLQTLPSPTINSEDNVAVQNLDSPKKIIESDGVFEGTIASFKPKYQAQLKDKRLTILDGKYAGHNGSFGTWNGTNCFITIDNIGRRAISIYKRIRVVWHD